MNLGVIIQARMGSSRLPGKVLRPLHGRPLLAHILDRLQAFRQPAAVVVATSDHGRDDAILAFCRQRDTRCFRGDEADVLARFWHCAREYGFTDVVRLTADNPFVDVSALDDLIALHAREKADLTHSFPSLPVGVGAEVMTFPALEMSFQQARNADQREHVDEFILQHPERFRICILPVEDGRNRPDLRLTVDTEEDLRRADFIAANAAGRDVSTMEAIELCGRFA